MKVKWLGLGCLLVFFLAVGTASAASVSFYAVDGDFASTGSVTLDVTNFFFTYEGNDYNTIYSTNGSTWALITDNEFTVSTTNGFQQVYLAVAQGNSTTPVITTGNLDFDGYAGVANGLPLYNSLHVTWDIFGIGISIATP
ncbi:MAG: hypothetical protein AB1560_13090, partial [Pseudomonadota bacterium]